MPELREGCVWLQAALRATMLRLLQSGPASSLSRFLALAGIGDLRPRFEAEGFFTLECLLEADLLAVLQKPGCAPALRPHSAPTPRERGGDVPAGQGVRALR